MLPPSDKLSICYAHVAYRLHERFSALDTGISSFAVRDLAGLEKRVDERRWATRVGGRNR